MEELKPCPFCGGEAMLTQSESLDELDEFFISDYVNCSECEAQGQEFLGWDDEDETERQSKAVSSWNTRIHDKENEKQTSKYQCPWCEEVYSATATGWYMRDWNLYCRECAAEIFSDTQIGDITHTDFDEYKV